MTYQKSGQQQEYLRTLGIQAIGVEPTVFSVRRLHQLAVQEIFASIDSLLMLLAVRIHLFESWHH